MKKIMKRGVSLCMAVALLLTATALAPPASAAGEEMSLEYAVATSVRDSYEYDGEVKKPGFAVTLNGKSLIEDRDYEVFSDAIDAGIATAVLTGKGNYHGSRTVLLVIRTMHV